MMPRDRWLRAGVAGLALFLPLPLAAQAPSLKLLWTQTHRALGGMGGGLQASRILGSGDSWQIEGLLAVLSGGSDRIEIAVPSLRVMRSETSLEVRPEGLVAVMAYSGRSAWVVEIAPDPGTPPWRDGGRLSFDGTTAHLAVEIGALNARLVEAVEGGTPLGQSFEARLDGFMVAGGLTGPSPFDFDLTARAGAMRSVLDLPRIGPLGDRLAADTRLGGFELRLAGTRVSEEPPASLEAAFAEGFRLSGLIDLGGFEAALDQTGRGEAIRSVSRLGRFRIEGEAADGAVSASGQIAGVAVEVSGSPWLTGTAALQDLSVSLAMPLVPTPEPGEMRVSQRLAGLAVSPTLLRMAPPGVQVFGDLPLGFESELRARLRWLGDPTTATAGGAPPLEVTGIAGRLGASLGATVFSAVYDLVAAADTIARLDGDRPPDVSGTVSLELRGSAPLFELLARSGLVPPAELAQARMVLGAFGRAVGDDHLVSDIEIRPGGAVFINGLPAPF